MWKNAMTEHEFVVTGETAGKRLDALAAEIFEKSRSAIQKLAEEGFLKVNGRTKEKNYRVRVGDALTLVLPEPRKVRTEAEDLPLEILYQDEDLAVVNKPKEMVVHPAAGNEQGTLVNALLFHLDRLSGINGVIRPGIVHRIDKNTSGLLMVAKNDSAHNALAAQIKEHSFLRRYHAIVLGTIREEEGDVDAPIGRHPAKRKQMAVVPNGRPAFTHYRVLERFNGFTYLELTLKTGRTHQIRVHMAHIGHPILGDTLYGGGKTPFEKKHKALLCEQTLHAKDLGFVHPGTGKYMEFTSPLPEYFRNLLVLLRNQTT